MPTHSNRIELFIFESRADRIASSAANQQIDTSRYMKMASSSMGSESFVQYGFPTSMDTSNFILPRRVFFTDHGRFFLHKPLDSIEILRYGECTDCPAGKTTYSVGGYTIKDCICTGDKWLDESTLECRTTDFCKQGQYVVQYGTERSNYNCSNCGMCPPGTWRNMSKCSPTQKNDLDANDVTECVPCGPCGRGYYMNMSACDGTTTARPPPSSSFCVKCRDCPDMHNIDAYTECNGQVDTKDTRQCIFCSEPCGPNADNYYIPSTGIEIGCDGKTLSTEGRSFFWHFV